MLVNPDWEVIVIDSNTVIPIISSGMGRAVQELQHKLVSTYLRLLDENDILPGAICFYTEGVWLAVEGSPLLDQMRRLEAKSVRLILCSTCLNYYNLMDKVQVGMVGGMGDILEAQEKATNVVSI